MFRTPKTRFTKTKNTNTVDNYYIQYCLSHNAEWSSSVIYIKQSIHKTAEVTDRLPITSWEAATSAWGNIWNRKQYFENGWQKGDRVIVSNSPKERSEKLSNQFHSTNLPFITLILAVYNTLPSIKNNF